MRKYFLASDGEDGIFCRGLSLDGCCSSGVVGACSFCKIQILTVRNNTKLTNTLLKPSAYDVIGKCSLALRPACRDGFSGCTLRVCDGRRPHRNHHLFSSSLSSSPAQHLERATPVFPLTDTLIYHRPRLQDFGTIDDHGKTREKLYAARHGRKSCPDDGY